MSRGEQRNLGTQSQPGTPPRHTSTYSSCPHSGGAHCMLCVAHPSPPAGARLSDASPPTVHLPGGWPGGCRSAVPSGGRQCDPPAPPAAALTLHTMHLCPRQERMGTSAGACWVRGGSNFNLSALPAPRWGAPSSGAKLPRHTGRAVPGWTARTAPTWCHIQHIGIRISTNHQRSGRAALRHLLTPPHPPHPPCGAPSGPGGSDHRRTHRVPSPERPRVREPGGSPAGGRVAQVSAPSPHQAFTFRAPRAGDHLLGVCLSRWAAAHAAFCVCACVLPVPPAGHGTHGPRPTAAAETAADRCTSVSHVAGTTWRGNDANQGRGARGRSSAGRRQ